MTARGRIVLLGMMSKMPVAGVVWQTAHYLLGFRQLGYDVTYVEAHGRTPSAFMTNRTDDGWARAAAFLSRTLTRFDLGDSWAYHAVDVDRCFGKTTRDLERLYDAADLIVNLHGGTVPREEVTRTGRLVYLETDPVEVQLQLHRGEQAGIGFLEAHVAHFTFAENYGRPGCSLPTTDRFRFHPTRQPVVLEAWSRFLEHEGDIFTTVGNWSQHWRDVSYEGETYSWSKSNEFSKVLDLPQRTGTTFELALSSLGDADRRRLESAGWRVRDALLVSEDPDTYRDYIGRSRGEFTVAKEQNVRFRTGWFSDRSATYLASGRPVITQDTGFGSVLPLGVGLFAFGDGEEAAEACRAIEADPARHRKGAAGVAAEYFDHRVVLGALLDELGLPSGPSISTTSPTDEAETRTKSGHPISGALVLTPLSRRPLRLRPETLDAIQRIPVPPVAPDQLPGGGEEPQTSIIVVSYNTLPVTKLCLTSVLINSAARDYELIVVDNASDDGSREFLQALAAAEPRVRLVMNHENTGFPRACNQGAAIARGRLIVLLNSDTIVAPGWLGGLRAPLADPAIGMVGPVTNRIGNGAQIDVDVPTYRRVLEVARERRESHAERSFEIDTLLMFCVAFRRSLFDEVGPLDERFGMGMLEDDDYALRVRATGRSLRCLEDTFVYHFGEASFGNLYADGQRSELLEANKRRFAEKWGRDWRPYQERRSPEYDALARRFVERISATIPPDAAVLVLSRGDARLVAEHPSARHFPAGPDRGYAGLHPASSEQAIDWLEAARRDGARYLAVPFTALWWLEHYRGLERHLRQHYRLVLDEPETCRVYSL